MNYTLIAYKPTSDDYCRGCHMATYWSDFKLTQTTIPDDIVTAAAQLYSDNEFMDCNEAGFELTLLEDGVEADTDGLLDAARAKSKEMTEARKERERKAAEALKQAADAQRLEQERKEYEKLKAKFA